MKISYNWLKDYINTQLTPEQIGDVLTSIGLEVEGIETVESIPGGLKGVVVGEVLECEKHPDADRLRVTKVNLGSGEPVQIVCGAPNVAQGQKVLVATIGTTLHPVSGEALTIKKGKIRGQESHGMICAEDELGLGESHAGIMVLDSHAQPGTSAADFLQISSDYLLEIGLTPNRTDAISHFGVARDLAAALRNADGKMSEDVKAHLPSIAHFSAPNNRSEIEVIVENNIAAPRYSGLVLKNIKVEESPKWLKERLATIGLRSINNVVDITNYVQHETGQPLHAFDAAKIEGKKVIVRNANAGETFVTLDGAERKLHSDDLMICDATKPMCIAGVFGGDYSGVSESTTEVFLESAWFNAVSVRKTARRHGLNTDASFRFERGTDPEMVPYALQRASLLMQEICGATVASEVFDAYPNPAQRVELPYSWKRAETLIGPAIPKEVTKSILQDLDIEIVSESEEGLQLSIPLYRVDVTREADVIEEVLRIYGYNNIAFPKGLKTSLSFAPQPDPEALQNKVADMLSANGFSEMMSMSLTKAKYTGLSTKEEYSDKTAVQLLNPLSNDLAVMRQSLLFSGLEAIALNQNHRNSDLRLYEFGKEYRKAEDQYNESVHLAIYAVGRRFPESWNNPATPVSFADVRAQVDTVLKACGIHQTVVRDTNDDFFAEGLDIHLAGKRGPQGIEAGALLVRIGRVSDHMLQAFDVKDTVWFADIHWTTLLASLTGARIQYSAPEKFPFVRRDLSLLLNKEVRFGQIEQLAFDTERKLLRQVGLFDVYEGKNLEAGKKSYAVSFILQDSTKTMTDDQTEKIMQKILNALQEKLGATLRG